MNIKDDLTSPIILGLIGAVVGILISYLSIKFFLPDFIDLRILMERSLCGDILECIKQNVNIRAYITLQYLLYSIVGFAIGFVAGSLLKIRK